MIENNNFPWYLQQSPVFTELYYGLFDVAVSASPLDIGDSFDLDNATGERLYRLGTYFGLPGTPYTWNGMIYNMDNWSDIKTWTGTQSELLSDTFYRNLIKAKAYAYGRPYSLITLKNVLDRIFDGIEYSAQIIEQGSIAGFYVNYGSVTEIATVDLDYGSVEDAADTEIDYGALDASSVPIQTITIALTAPQDVLTAFITVRGFDLDFIGHPTGIKVVWEYNYV